MMIDSKLSVYLFHAGLYVSNVITVWHCNTTGIYSGFQNEGTLAESFSRGLQPTDEKGVMQMETSVPGWYVGRATRMSHPLYTP